MAGEAAWRGRPVIVTVRRMVAAGGFRRVGVYWDDDAWCMYLDEDVYWVVSTRADALAFFKLVRWPVEVGKILEGRNDWQSLT